MSGITREEHIQWCKERAIESLNCGGAYSAIVSMMSDLRKHPETNDETLQSLCRMEMLNNPSRQMVINFINEFN